MFDIDKLRNSPKEQLRINDLMNLTPRGESVLEIGARDCYLSRKLTELYDHVTALDLEMPVIDHPKITPVKGDITCLGFDNESFDTLFCTEVLEHIPSDKLQTACNEIMRTAKRYAVIGVPYNQDLRANRLKCCHCGSINPPTGHINRFDKDKLVSLFSDMKVVEVRYIGYKESVTNFISTKLYEWCGYPYGSYHQEEGCINCGKKMQRPKIGAVKWSICFVARAINAVQNKLTLRERPNWIHILCEKQ